MAAKNRPYFRPEDFSAFAMSLAQSEDPGVIAARKRVVEERMKPPHFGTSAVPGL